MLLATLDRVKAKLQIPESDETKDRSIQDVLNSTIRWTQDRTRFGAAGTYQDILYNVQIGRHYKLSRRPLDPNLAVVAEGRMYGTPAAWTPLTADLINPMFAEIVLLGMSGFYQSFPPVEAPAPWFKWSQPIWPIGRFTFVVVDALPPDDLSDAVAAFAAYLWRRQLTGHLVSASIGAISETYSQRGVAGGVPEYVASIIDSYVPTLAQWAP